jgi:cell division protein ZapE
VIHIPTTIDYRLQHLKNTASFFTPNDVFAHKQMEETFSILADTEQINHLPIKINDRSIPIIKQANDIIWFKFNVLCHKPRSQHDYLVIAEKYSTVLVSDVTRISADEKNLIALFIRMIDIFYDMHVRLIFSAEVPIEQIYTEGYLLTDFKRTRSRLIEMQSEKYLTSRIRQI